jgi:hypothetical protein
VNAREASASFGYDYVLRQCRLRGRVDTDGKIAALLEERYVVVCMDRSLADSPARRLTDSPTHRLAHSPTRPLTDSPTHRLTDSPTIPFFSLSLSG